MDTQPNLIDLFNHIFEVVRADTPVKRRECYRLRYEVYCKEALVPGFNMKDYPDGLEYDQYDERSVHSLLLHKPSGLTAGTVRIILANPENLAAKFPLEKCSGNALYADSISLKNFPRSRLGEISRLILAPEFRARKGESRRPYGIKHLSYSFKKNRYFETSMPFNNHELHNDFQRRKIPHAILGLFVAITRMSVENSLSYWYGGMEPSLERFCRTFGIKFTPISPNINYYGSCRSYLGYIPDIMDGIYQNNTSVWTLLTNDGEIFPGSKLSTQDVKNQRYQFISGKQAHPLMTQKLPASRNLNLKKSTFF